MYFETSSCLPRMVRGCRFSNVIPVRRYFEKRRKDCPSSGFECNFLCHPSTVSWLTLLTLSCVTYDACLQGVCNCCHLGDLKYNASALGMGTVYLCAVLTTIPTLTKGCFKYKSYKQLLKS